MEFIVTGANSGIGFEIAKGLLEQPGSHVIMGCRDMKTGAAKQSELQACSSTRGICECFQLDLEDLSSVKSFALEQRARLKKEGKTLHVLVNNAGVLGVPNAFGTNEDRHMTINHVGPFLLTKLLLPSMTQGSRVVNVASSAHYFASIHFDAQGKLDQNPTWWSPQYGRSKLANILFTSELQKREGASRGINCYSMCPGAVNTPIFSQLPFAGLLKLPFSGYFMRTPKQGAKTAGYCALSPELEGKHVLFLSDEREKQPSVLLLARRSEHERQMARRKHYEGALAVADVVLVDAQLSLASAQEGTSHSKQQIVTSSRALAILRSHGSDAETRLRLQSHSKNTLTQLRITQEQAASEKALNSTFVAEMEQGTSRAKMKAETMEKNLATMKSRRDELSEKWSQEEKLFAVSEQQEALVRLKADGTAAMELTLKANADAVLMAQAVAAREREDGQHVKDMQAKIGEARTAKLALAERESEMGRRHRAAAAEAARSSALLLKLDTQLQETSSIIYLLTGEHPQNAMT